MQNNQHAIEKSVFQWMRYCTFPLLHAWSTLALLVFEELKRRRELIRVNSLAESLDIPGNTTQSRLDLLYLQFRAMASQAAFEVAGSLEEIPSLSRVTHINYSNLSKWGRFLLQDADVQDLSLTQRVWALERQVLPFSLPSTFPETNHQITRWTERCGIFMGRPNWCRRGYRQIPVVVWL